MYPYLSTSKMYDYIAIVLYVERLSTKCKIPDIRLQVGKFGYQVPFGMQRIPPSGSEIYPGLHPNFIMVG